MTDNIELTRRLSPIPTGSAGSRGSCVERQSRIGAYSGSVPFSLKTGWIETLGATPMFYYNGHPYALHLLAWVAALLSGFPLVAFDVSARFGGVPEGFGFPLWATIPFSLLTTLVLLPACAWYARQRRRRTWLRYL